MEEFKVLAKLFGLFAVLAFVLVIESIITRDGMSGFMWSVVTYACLRMVVKLNANCKKS